VLSPIAGRFILFVNIAHICSDRLYRSRELIDAVASKDAHVGIATVCVLEIEDGTLINCGG
jgi:hypothetical protein